MKPSIAVVALVAAVAASGCPDRTKQCTSDSDCDDQQECTSGECRDRGSQGSSSSGGSSSSAGTTSSTSGSSAVHRSSSVNPECPTGVQGTQTRMLGQAGPDWASDVVMDAAGNIYLAGATQASLTTALQVLLVKWAPDGTQLWRRAFGPQSSRAEGLAVDADGNVFFCGTTTGSFPGYAHNGWDVIVGKYNSNGEEQWVVQLTGDENQGVDSAYAMALDSSGDVFVGGKWTGNLPGHSDNAGYAGFVARLSAANGSMVWGTLLGDQAVWSMAVADHALFVAGSTSSTVDGETPVGGEDIMVARLALDGSLTWARLMGSTARDESAALTVVGDAVYVAGTTEGTLPGLEPVNARDMVVLKYSMADGTLAWSRTVGSTANLHVNAMAAAGNQLYVVGDEEQDDADQSLHIMVRALDMDGRPVWKRTVGRNMMDMAFGACAAGDDVLVAGTVGSAVDGQPSAGSTDAILLRYHANGCRL